MTWEVWLIVICPLVMGILTWIIYKQLHSKPIRVRSPNKVGVRPPTHEPSPLHKKSLKLEDDPLYRKIVQKLQTLDHEIRTLPLHSARRRFLEGQRWFYAVIRTKAEEIDRVRTKSVPSNSSSNYQ